MECTWIWIPFSHIFTRWRTIEWDTSVHPIDPYQVLPLGPRWRRMIQRPSPKRHWVYSKSRFTSPFVPVCTWKILRIDSNLTFASQLLQFPWSHAAYRHGCVRLQSCERKSPCWNRSRQRIRNMVGSDKRVHGVVVRVLLPNISLVIDVYPL